MADKFLDWGPGQTPPAPVSATESHWKSRLEGDPVAFALDSDEALWQLRCSLAHLVGAAPERLLWLPQTRQGIERVAAHLALSPGDEVLASDHEYPISCDMWRQRAQAHGYTYRQVHLPLPVSSHDNLIDRLWQAVTPRTRVLYVSHITCLTALQLPLQQLCRRAREEGIVTVVDGAHAAGQIDLNLSELDADFYCGCLHKWLRAPYGAAFLYCREPWANPPGLEAAHRIPLLASPELRNLPGLEQARRAALRAREAVSDWARQPAFQPASEEWTARMISVPLPPELGDPLPLQAALAARGFRTNGHLWQGIPMLRLCFGAHDGEAEVAALLQALRQIQPSRRPSLWATLKKRIVG